MYTIMQHIMLQDMCSPQISTYKVAFTIWLNPHADEYRSRLLVKGVPWGSVKLLQDSHLKPGMFTKRPWQTNIVQTTSVSPGTTSSSTWWATATHRSGQWLSAYRRMQHLLRHRYTTTSSVSQHQRGSEELPFASEAFEDWLCQQFVSEEKSLEQFLTTVGQCIKGGQRIGLRGIRRGFFCMSCYMIKPLIWTLCSADKGKDSDQHGHQPRLIGVFTVHMKKVKTLIRLGRCPGQSEFWLDSKPKILVLSYSGLYIRVY